MASMHELYRQLLWLAKISKKTVWLPDDLRKKYKTGPLAYLKPYIVDDMIPGCWAISKRMSGFEVVEMGEKYAERPLCGLLGKTKGDLLKKLHSVCQFLAWEYLSGEERKNALP